MAKKRTAPKFLRQDVLKQIWERDGAVCGKHLQGCGQSLPLADAEIGHIVPKCMVYPPRDHMLTRRQRKEFHRLNPDFPRGCLRHLNIQPMHRECNSRMGSVFPPTPIVTHCKCCRFTYVISEQGRIRPIRPDDFERKARGQEIGLTRTMKVGGGVLQIFMPFTIPVLRVSKDPEHTQPVMPAAAIMAAPTGAGFFGARTFGPQPRGAAITLTQMLRHNAASPPFAPPRHQPIWEVAIKRPNFNGRS